MADLISGLPGALGPTTKGVPRRIRARKVEEEPITKPGVAETAAESEPLSISACAPKRSPATSAGS